MDLLAALKQALLEAQANAARLLADARQHWPHFCEQEPRIKRLMTERPEICLREAYDLALAGREVDPKDAQEIATLERWWTLEAP